MHWKMKGLAQKTLGVLPGGAGLHYALQRRYGGLRDFSGELAVKVDDWSIMAGHLRDAGVPIAGTRFVEIGSGWYPTLPLCLMLGGAAAIHTYDLNRNLKPELALGCMHKLGEFLPEIAKACDQPLAEVQARHAQLLRNAGDGSDLSKSSGGVIHYAAPADAARTGLSDASVDVVYSNSVLEHVLPEVIPGLYVEAMRVLRPDGIMFHSVNCGDHYAYIDGNIHQLNYLQYSDEQWRFWDNEFLYQNRLRAHTFLDMARDAGFHIELDTTTVDEDRLRQIKELPVDSQFAGLSDEALCITSVDFIARKQGA